MRFQLDFLAPVVFTEPTNRRALKTLRFFQENKVPIQAKLVRTSLIASLDGSFKVDWLYVDRSVPD